MVSTVSGSLVLFLKMGLKLTAFVLLLACVQTFADDATRDESGFILTVPSTLTYGKNENVCLSLHNTEPPAEGTITFKTDSRDDVVVQRTFTKKLTCFLLQVPQWNVTETLRATVEVQIQANGVQLSGNNSIPIAIVAINEEQNVETFLQTDRQMYKPGDVLKIRILVINKEFFTGEEQKIPTVKLVNPDDITVAVWRNVSTKQGLFHLEYQLSDETVEGQWRIEANDQIKDVEVKKYVLPRFKVELIHPEEVYIKSKQMHIKACAKYSYGQPVKGIAKLNISRHHYYYWSNEDIGRNITKSKELKSGCAEFTVYKEEIDLQPNHTYYWWIPMQIEAVVTEVGTNQTEEAKGSIRFTTEPLQLEISADEDVFRTGLPYEAELKIKNFQDYTNITVPVCYDLIDGRDGWKTYFTGCFNFTVNSEASIPFTIPPFTQNISWVQLRATCCEQEASSYRSLYRIYSATGYYVYLKQNEDVTSNCERMQNFTVYYTIKDKDISTITTFYYVVKSNDKIYFADEISVEPQNIRTFQKDSLQNLIEAPTNYTDYSFKTASFNIHFELDPKILLKYTLLVYRSLPNGEMIVGTTDVEIEPCLPNKVDINWSKQEIQPGEEATLSIKTSPKSLCSISTVDEATKFRSSDNFNVRTLVDRLRQSYRPYYYFYRDYTLNCPNVNTTQEVDGHYEWGPEVYSDKDTNTILDDSGVSVITNLRTVTKPCVKREIRRYALEAGGFPGSADADTANLRSSAFPEHAVYASAGVPIPPSAPVPKENSEHIVPIRSFFPETWLWELIPADINGAAELVRDAPHSITTWVSNAICVSPTEGIGMSETRNVITFQPFFIDVITPYSIKRGEILHLVVKAFNYLNHSLPVRVSILQQNGLEAVDGYDSPSKCVDGSDSLDFVYRIRSTEIGKVNVTVIGEVDASAADKCGESIHFQRRDVVKKALLVEPEGFPVEKVKSALLCANDSQSNDVSWTLQVPQGPNLVPGSAKSKVIFNSDILGSTVENLDRLLIIPTGCGEQVMSKLAPNLHVLRYLNTTNQLTPETKNKAVGNIKIGYQKILTYKHNDGSFSAFGERDGSGSMFLTAFVVRTLTQAKPYIFIDDAILNKSVTWIFDHQSDNGCFPPMNHLFQRLGDDNESVIVVTSYVLISLKEADIKIPNSIAKKAIGCISEYSGNNSYPLALISYALHLAGLKTEGRKRLEESLKELKTNKNSDEDRYYSYYSSNKVETYGYNLLSYLSEGDADSITQASTLVQWLSRQMSPRGGYASTQDTVVALDALSKYSTVVQDKPNIKVHFVASGQDLEFSISGDDQIKVTTFPLKQAEDTVQLRISGKGCVLAQAASTYNVYSLTQTPSFSVTVEPETNFISQHCTDANLKICVVYNGPDAQSSMVVMEVGIPSGYSADEESLSKFLFEGNSGNKIRRYEQNENGVVVYFVGLTREALCVSFDIAESQKVENRTVSTVNIYDYYKPEDKASVLYELKDCE